MHTIHVLVFCLILVVAEAAALSPMKIFKQRVAASVAILPLVTLTAFCAPLPSLAVVATEPEIEVMVLNGVVGLSSTDLASVAPRGEKTALYITVREDVGVWTSAVRNIKPPPIMSKRMTNIKNFPVSVTLNSKEDITPEGAATLDEWKNRPLTISTRLDSDGVAATRDPADLVGQGEAKLAGKDGGWESFNVDLIGRGVAGKFITNKK